MDKSERLIRLTGITPILGSAPASETIYTDYVATKAPAVDVGIDETEALPYNADKQSTVFLRHPKTDALCVRDYHIVGLLKEAGRVLKHQIGIAMPDKKIGQYVFAMPTYIPLLRDGEEIIDEDSMYERPCRTDAFRGPASTLKSSEQVDTPWYVEAKLILLDNKPTKESKAITWETIAALLDYGALKGLGQFRNGGYGRFTWEWME